MRSLQDVSIEPERKFNLRKEIVIKEITPHRLGIILRLIREKFDRMAEIICNNENLPKNITNLTK